MGDIVDSGSVIAKIVHEPESLNVAIARLEERVGNMHSDMNELGGVLGVGVNFLMGWLGK